MRKCSKKTKEGNPCKAVALAGKETCFFHDPASKKARKKAQASGGKRRARGPARTAPKAKKAKAEEPAAETDISTMNVVDGAKLDGDRLEALLATAISLGVEGQLSAPVLANITKLVTTYDGFLARKRDRGDTELVRTMSTTELNVAMLNHLPLSVLKAEVEKRGRRKKDADVPLSGNGHAAAVGSPDVRGRRSPVQGDDQADRPDDNDHGVEGDAGGTRAEARLDPLHGNHGRRDPGGTRPSRGEDKRVDPGDVLKKPVRSWRL